MPDLIVAKGNDNTPAPNIAVDNPKILPNHIICAKFYNILN